MATTFRYSQPPLWRPQPEPPLNLLLTTLATPTAPPFVPVVPENPTGRQFPTDLRTHIHQVDLNLLGQDQFFGLAGHPWYDWPNPVGPQFPVELRTWIQSNITTVLAPTGPAPFAQTDWPNPRGAEYSIALRTFINEVPLNLLGKDAMAFSQLDWPVPNGALTYPAMAGFVQPTNPNLFPPRGAPPNLKRLFIDLDTGNLIWRLTN